MTVVGVGTMTGAVADITPESLMLGAPMTPVLISPAPPLAPEPGDGREGEGESGALGLEGDAGILGVEELH